MCLQYPVGRPRVELWSDFVLALDVLGELHAVWSLGICFPLSVAILLVAEFDSMLSSVLEGLVFGGTAGANSSYVMRVGALGLGKFFTPEFALTPEGGTRPCS